MKKELTFHHEEFKNVSEDAKTLIRKILKKDPNERIKLEDVLQDKWMLSGSKQMEVNLNNHKDVVDKISN